MVKDREELEGLNTDACVVEISGLGEDCWATAYCISPSSLFRFHKPSERSCLWLTGKFPYHCKHKLARHLNDVQTCVCERIESSEAGWETGSVVFSFVVHVDLESLSLCWEGRAWRPFGLSSLNFRFSFRFLACCSTDIKTVLHVMPHNTQK